MTMSAHRLLLAVAALAWLGCGPGDATPDGGDASADVDAGPAPRPAPPQIRNQQGPVIASPKVVPVFFANDADQPQLEDFLTKLASSSVWSAETSEYGVGPLTVESSVVAADAPPVTIDTTGIEAWLTQNLDGTHAGWPALDASAIVAVFYPSSTTVQDATFGTSCTDFNGFHFESLKTTGLVYAVIPRCAAAGPLVGLDGLTASLSHELVEAATDPNLQTAPAWQSSDDDHLIWNFVPGAEVADMCDLEPQSFQRLVGSYMVQRTWSNASALAGHDPCVPPLAQPYFVAAPVLDTSVLITYGPQVLTTKGLKLAQGDSKTIDVRLFADAPTGDWKVDALDVDQPPTLSFSWDAQTGNDGDTLHLTITRTTSGGGEFAITSTSGTTTNLWFGFVAD